MSLQKDYRPARADNKGILDGLWSGELKCSGPKATEAHWWKLIWVVVHRTRQEGLLLEVEHVKAHRPKKEEQEMTLFESFVAEGNKRVDERAKDGALLDGGEMAQIRASTAQQKQEEVHAVLQYAARFQCLVEVWHDCEELKPRA